MTTEIEIILPPTADQSDPLEFSLIALTQAIGQINSAQVAHGLLGGEYGYGAHWENDVFLMHPYCWCGKEGECPWCTGCAVYQDAGACKVCSDEGLSLEQRRSAPPEQKCDYSSGRGVFARFGPWTLDHQRHYYDPPNFWHKASNFRVTWYKWIGRETTTNGISADLAAIFAECLASLPSRKFS